MMYHLYVKYFRKVPKLGKYGDSGADVSVNTDQSPEKMGSNMD